jgi:hypothetical protein
MMMTPRDGGRTGLVFLLVPEVFAASIDGTTRLSYVQVRKSLLTV